MLAKADEIEELWSEDLDAIAEMGPETLTNDSLVKFVFELARFPSSGVNTIRIYDLDPEKSHKKFMDKAARFGLGPQLLNSLLQVRSARSRLAQERLTPWLRGLASTSSSL